MVEKKTNYNVCYIVMKSCLQYNTHVKWFCIEHHIYAITLDRFCRKAIFVFCMHLRQFVHTLIKDCRQCTTNRFLKLSISRSVQWLALARSSLANEYLSCTLVHRFVPQLHRGQVNNSARPVTFWWDFGTGGPWQWTGKAVDRRGWKK
jgi:hypothetical protein